MLERCTFIRLHLAICAVTICSSVFGATIVVPNNQASATGNTAISSPFMPTRFQQTLGSGQFQNAIIIVGLRLRSSPGTGPLNYAATSFQVTVSSTQVYPNTNNNHSLPSTTYANNVGPDASVVYNGPILLTSAGCPAPGPCPFDAFIPFSAPFSYDPTKARLLIDISSAGTSGSGSFDAVSFTDSTQSTVAVVSGDPTKPSGALNLAGLVFGVESGTPCSSQDNPPCTVAGTLLATSASGPLFGDSGGTATGVTANHTNTVFINDPQNAGVSNSGMSGPLLSGAGPGAQLAVSGTLNLSTLSGAATLNGGVASITCGVTGSATLTMTIAVPSGNTVLTCPKTSTPGIAVQVFGRVNFSPTKSTAVTLTVTGSAPASGDTFTMSGYSVQASFVSSGPSIISDVGVINGGNYEAGKVVSGSWVAIKGSGFTDPGVTVDWSKSDFSNGLPTSLNGVQVLFNGQAGAMWYLIDGPTQQINVQAPANLSGNISVQVVRNKAASNVVATTAVPVSPGIFSYSLDGGTTFFPAAVFGNGNPLGDPTIYPGARAAKAGDTVVIFANSLAASPAGVVQVSGSTHPVTITIGPSTFPADFSGLVAPGEFQINFTVPKIGSSGNLPFTVTIDGQSSQAGVVFPYSN
jgi:uncharacterized protein (TIGR03437 family)